MLTDECFTQLMDFMMCADQIKAPQDHILALMDGEAKARGHDNWVVAYHEMPRTAV